MNRQIPAWINVAILLLILITTVALAWPRFFLRGESRINFLATQNGKALNTALLIYSQAHGGSYPDEEKIQGGTARDELVRSGVLTGYPPDPCSEGRLPIKKTDASRFAPCGFVYHRDPVKKYEYTLIVFGAKKKVYDSTAIRNEEGGYRRP
ncbi:MAG TPA: hypothetical protein PLQ76_08195 [bacterium]|nr:hypothetical protein [bacterium]